MNIFVVEDNDLDVEILSRGLRKNNLNGSLTRAKDGVEALEMLTDEATRRAMPHPLVILLDINMPRMNGHEFLAALRETDAIRDERVFVFTTSDSSNDINLAYERNANGYIVKPNSAAELREVLLLLQQYCDVCKHPVKGNA